MKILQIRNEENTSNYNSQRKLVKHICRRKKRDFLERQIKTIDEAYQKKEIRNFYKDIQNVKSTKHESSQYITDLEGNLIGDDEGKLRRWEQYFEQILKSEIRGGQREEQKQVPKKKNFK
ncbi:hypothetical protein Zmor_021733 [Zophobas morio]|uniref:Uncharacterized protein n=1 Tax=Zophobas morio TaxID=2755281 RepID=A0AA38I8Q4_9CUCU|nr:hypothetical protein Zmor_021733 [Zophobas morio]